MHSFVAFAVTLLLLGLGLGFTSQNVPMTQREEFSKLEVEYEDSVPRTPRHWGHCLISVDKKWAICPKGFR